MKWFNHIAIAASTMAVVSAPLVPIAILGATAPDWLERLHVALTGIRLRHRGPTHFVVMWMLGLFATLSLYDVHHIGAAFFYGGLTHVVSDAFTVTGVPFSPLSDRRFHLFGGRIRTGNPEEYLASGSVVIVCAIIAIATRHYADVSYAPFFFDYPAYYQDGLVDAKEWRDHRFKFF